jgi:branched-chain amino acid transport system substrate-binding protein
VGYGLAMAYTFVDALAKAGTNPTRQSIAKTIESSNLRGPGLTPFRYSKDSHAGFTGVQIGVVKNGAVELQGQPMTTDDQSGAIQPFTGAAVSPPANGVPKA